MMKNKVLIEMSRFLISIGRTLVVIHAIKSEKNKNYAPHLYLAKASITNAAKE